jgi:ABC-type transport system involved in multi-copper enzyme maturation permease subunit
MLWLIIEKEFLSNLLTSRFLIGLITCLLSISIATYVQVDDYGKRLQAYTTSVKGHKAEIDDWDVYVKINPKVDRKPNQLSIFNQGVDKRASDIVYIDLTYIPCDLITKKMGSDNPIMGIFLSIDAIFIFQMVISLLAILFAYDAISGERENGTLSLTLSNAVPRDTILIGKYLGGMLSLLPTLIISLIVALLVAQLSPYTSFNGTDLLRIVLMFAISLLYVSCFYLLGLFLSTRTKQATTTLILAMFIWVNLTIVYPNAAEFMARAFQPYKHQPDEQQIFQLWDDFQKERDNYVKKRGRENAMDGISAKTTGVRTDIVAFGLKETPLLSDINEEKSDFSFFHQFLAYQELLRIRYADKVGQIIKKSEELDKRTERFIKNLSRVSFATAYDDATAILAGTDVESYYNFMEQARRYRHEIVQYLNDKKAFSSRQWYLSDKGKADFTGMPVFQQRSEEVRESIKRALSDILILFIWNVIFFMGAYLSFLRYDVR